MKSVLTPVRVLCPTLVLSFVLAVHAAPSLQTVPGHLPPGLDRAQALGPLPAGQRLNIGIGLPLRNQPALAKLLEQLYTPGDPNYRRFLTPDQFTERFGPTEADYQAVVAFAQANGLQIVHKHSNRVLLDVNGTVDQIEKAFHVALYTYHHPNEDRDFFAPDREPALELDVPILHISGLDDFVVPRPASLHVRPIETSAATARRSTLGQVQDTTGAIDGEPTATGNPGADSGAEPLIGSGPGGTYMGRDFRAAYVPNVPWTGAGQSVGLVQFDGYYPSDIAAYVSLAGLPTVPITNVLLNGVSGGPGQNNIEVALDIEMCISMAPGLSSVIVYEGTMPNTILSRMATDNLAKQLSASWTFPTDSTTESLYQQLIAQGQGYFNASGDGDAYAGVVRTPCDSPSITCVGGTTLRTASAGGAYSSEVVWNWYNNVGTGGGISTVWPIPPWQQGVNMSGNQGSTTMRNLPDVALIADNTLVLYDYGSQGNTGGTSISSPLWAAFMALVNQQAQFSGDPPVGFLNPTVYALGLGGSYNTLFHDIRTGNNTNATSPTRFFAATGYDLCTGWGSPTGIKLINALAPPIPARIVTAAAATMIFETCTNGAIDPGEAIGISLTLQNLGGVNTTNLVATLLNTNGVLYSSGSQTYGALVGLGAPISKTFTFMADGNCGGAISPTLQLQDGPTNLGLVSFSLPLGAPMSTWVQNFDSVTAPALPAGWTIGGSAGYSNWVTSAAARDTAPYSAFAYEATNASVTDLISPPIPVTLPTARFVFRQSFDTEVDPTGTAYDGGVLEMSIGGGAFQDILAAGATFVSNGYNRTIVSTNAENPLDGRLCWGGISGGFITTIINLPATAAGQNVQFKWRFGVDNMNGYGGTGWYVDTLALQEGTNCCVPSTNADLAVGQTASPSTLLAGQAMAYSIAVSNLGPAPAISVTLTDILPANVTFNFAGSGATILGDRIVWNFGLMTSGRTTNLTVLVTPNVDGPITNTLLAASAMNDPNLVNSSNANVAYVFGPPIITNQPVTQSVLPGSDATFGVGAFSSTPMGYQWQHAGTNLSGATDANLLLANVQVQMAGLYAAVLTNMAGSVTSAPATLKVLVAPTLSVGSLGVGQTNLSVSLQSLEGLLYTLEYKDALTDPAWTPLPPPLTGTGGVLVLQDTNAIGSQRFYRVNCN